MKKYRITKWIMLSLSALSSAFIIFNSCLSKDTTIKWNNAFSSLYTSFVNAITKSKTSSENVEIQNISISLSSKDDYVYNYIPGYEADCIPLGSAKQIECNFSPENATDKSITYSVEPADAAILNQSGSTLSVVGMKVGPAIITATSNDGNHTSTVDINVVKTVAPASYEISVANNSIALGTTQTIEFDIDGGPLTHDELINFRYYDTRKLSYKSSLTSVATVDDYGVIYPHNEGNATITVSNGSYSRSINIKVTSGAPTPSYTNLSISGNDVCFANDMIMDQSSKKHNYQLTPKDGETNLNPEDFIWESSDELLVKVDKHGVVRGFRKSSLDDEHATITARSKLTPQSATFDVTVKNQLPSKMAHCLMLDSKNVCNSDEYTIVAKEDIKMKFTYDVSIQNKKIIAESNDESIIKCTSEGDTVTLHTLKAGKCNIKFTSEINPDLSVDVKFTVLKEGSITTDQLSDITYTIRKSIGHAAVFMVAQIFTYLTLFMFLYDKKWWLYSSISLGEGLVLSFLSEFIQYLVPTRTFALLDVLIDFAGVVVGALIAFGIVMLIKHVSKKRLEKDKKKEWA